MVRKQIYLSQEQNRKLKLIAAARGDTEAEVIRDAVDRLPDPEGDLVQRLRAAGLLATVRVGDDVPTGEDLAELEAEVEAWLDGLTEPLGLTEAILAEREEAPY